MTAPHDPIRDDELEAYLDGQFDADALRHLEAGLASDPEALMAIQIQRRIDESLNRVFSPPATPVELIKAVHQAGPVATTEQVPDRIARTDSRRRRRRILLLTTAASVAWILVAWQWMASSPKEPAFTVRALTDVYRETVDAGFQPYYDCREEERFADVFRQRQDQPLRLATLPPGRRMLGLSYPGGLSRDTTAMLCEVDEQPVMVFIDRAQHDDPSALQSTESGLYVHRSRLGSLVLYEVSPWDSPKVMHALELVP